VLLIDGFFVDFSEWEVEGIIEVLGDVVYYVVIYVKVGVLSG